MSTGEALRLLLDGTGWRAVSVGSGVWRIERLPAHPIVPRTPAARRPLPLPPVPDIVVTGMKRRELFANTAASLAVLDTDRLAMLGDAPDTGSVASALTGLTVTNLGSGRDRLFIRGVADSPFDGFGQSSVSVQVAEARATYDAPDPDLRLVDMAQVELLKGPQGPLYGTGALGGVFRLVPARPDPGKFAGSLTVGTTFTKSGGAAGDVEAVVNAPILAGDLAVRAVGYRIGQGGWIDSGGPREVNHGQTSGLRVGVRARPGAWTIDVLGLGQSSSVADSQYVEGSDTLTRAPRIAEPQDTDFSLASLTATGPLNSMTLTAVASTARQELQATYDASAGAMTLGGTAPAAYKDDRHYSVSTAELRLAGRLGPLDMLAGVSWLGASTDASGTLSDTQGTHAVLTVSRKISETALFGEMTIRATHKLSGTVGLRLFRSAIDDERSQGDSNVAAIHAVMRASPSVTISWQPGERFLVFARYASALRPGGVQPPASTGGTAMNYQADELQSAELGVRWHSPAGFSVDGALFASTWGHVQADYLGSDGLVTTRNAGDANNEGLDLTLSWQPHGRWSLSLGVLAQHARITTSAQTTMLPDRRLPIVPDLAAHSEASYRFAVRRWDMRATLRASYIGETRLSFDPGLDRENEPVTNVAAALSASRSGWTVRGGVDNLLDSRADSFAFGNPFSVLANDQHTPVRPRTITLSLRRSW